MGAAGPSGVLQRPATSLIILTCMVATAISCAVQGLSGVPVTVEVDVANGLPSPTSVEHPIGPSRRRAEKVARRRPQRRLRIPAAAGDGQPRSATSWRTIGADVAYVWPAAFAEDALLSDPVLDGLIDSGVDLFGSGRGQRLRPRGGRGRPPRLPGGRGADRGRARLWPGGGLPTLSPGLSRVLIFAG